MDEVKDAAEMEAVMTQHINTIVGRYKGRVNGWDVVNEALNEDGTLRESIFLKTMGEGYLQKAFELAAAADLRERADGREVAGTLSQARDQPG